MSPAPPFITLPATAHAASSHTLPKLSASPPKRSAPPAARPLTCCVTSASRSRLIAAMRRPQPADTAVRSGASSGPGTKSSAVSSRRNVSLCTRQRFVRHYLDLAFPTTFPSRSTPAQLVPASSAAGSYSSSCRQPAPLHSSGCRAAPALTAALARKRTQTPGPHPAAPAPPPRAPQRRHQKTVPLPRPGCVCT